ncbi:hypothetical protein Goari_011756 [Gossypium aridum]|uniref:CAAX prenyl protease 2/Lysostaphin resistance protein A-like domain-containing protein n=1 Tax=Gossypium aridum TaxID=34290 RepID=A0A7J8WYE0_GOSAI|nr:hypothetical protein [Gossypium aridum]
MLLWLAAFWFIGSWMIPFAAHMAGFSKESLTFKGQALFSLVTDVTEGLAGIAILHRCLSHFHPLPSDWFKFSLRGKWLFDVALGCLMFPFVNQLSQFNLTLLPLMPSTPVTLSSVEQSILARDPVAMALYAIVVSICAPVWEEIVFRGFLLPSLTRYMPLWSAILESIAIYASAQPLERLCVLGFNEIINLGHKQPNGMKIACPFWPKAAFNLGTSKGASDASSRKARRTCRWNCKALQRNKCYLKEDYASQCQSPKMLDQASLICLPLKTCKNGWKNM